MNPAATQRKPLILVDGTACLYRAFHALPELSTTDGRPTNAIRGTISIIRRLRQTYAGADIVVVFDAPGKTFRHRQYPAYKATRPSMPDELREQIAPVHEIVRAMGLPLLSVADVEADDVIGSLAVQSGDRPVVIVSADKDLAQLVTERVSMLNTNRDETMDPDAVRRRFGVGPQHIPDYLGLVGDQSDNIPGVRGIGPKTAQALINALGSLEDIYAQLERIAGLPLRGAKGIAKKLEQARDEAMLSQGLATIRTDLQLEDADPDALSNTNPDRAALARLFEDLEFRGWSHALSGPGPAQPSAEVAEAAETAEILNDLDALRRWAQAPHGNELGLAMHATDTMPGRERICGLSLADAQGSVYIAIADTAASATPPDIEPATPPDIEPAAPPDIEPATPPAAPLALPADAVADALRPLLESPEIRWVAYDIKRLLGALAELGLSVRGPIADPMLSAYLLHSSGDHRWPSLVAHYLNEGAQPDTVAPGTPPDATALRARQSLALQRQLTARMDAEPALQSLLVDMELPVARVLARMERFGVRLDIERLRAHGVELEGRIAQMEQQAWEQAGRRFNVNSPQQLQVILYEELGLPARRRTGKGQPSTDESVLQSLVDEHPLPGTVLEYRELSKLLSTYVRALPEQVDARTGRLHTTYRQAGTNTGRLSSAQPNLQNIPIRGAEGRRVREAFVAADGYCLISADYSQIELRLMAHVSGDEQLRQAFHSGLDIHRATAAEMFGIADDAVSDAQRRSAKAINFGIIYGMSGFGLARRLDISRADADHYIQRYLARYSGVSDYMQRMRALAGQQGYVETLLGRRVFLPTRGSGPARRQSAERIAINAPVQGGAADIMKQAMIDLDQWLDASGADAQMTLQVHDELVLECAQDAVEEVSAALRSTMASAVSLSVPLVVELGCGPNWSDAH